MNTIGNPQSPQSSSNVNELNPDDNLENDASHLDIDQAAKFLES